MISNRVRCAAGSAAVTFLFMALASTAHAAPDFSGVWGMVQHDRLGAPFFIPIEPKLNDAGKAATDAFKANYDVAHHEANGACVEPGMPTVMWGIGGAAMEVVQQPQRITLLSELASQSRRIFLDGRAMPDSLPDQRVGFSVGHWDGDTLGARAAASLSSRLRDCVEGSHSRIENSRDEFFLDPGTAPTLFVSRYRATPGRAGDYMNFVRTEMMPLARRAKQNGTFAGWSVTTSVQLINQVEQSVLKRLPDMSY